MADELSRVLWSLAEYFNYTAVALIVLCSTLMVIFIIRLNGEHWGHYHNGADLGNTPLAYQKEVAEFINPFFLKLSSSVVSNLSDRVSMKISCLLPCKVHVFWGPTINTVHTSLLKKGTDFLDDLHNEVLLNDHCLATELYSIDAAGKEQLDLYAPKDVNANSFGQPPRQRYPCVVVMAATDTSHAVDHTSVVATVTVLHLRDSLCRTKSYIIAQYVKMAGDAVYNLQPLFFATEREEDGTDPVGQASQDTHQCQDDRQMTRPHGNSQDTHCRRHQAREGEAFTSTDDSRNSARPRSELESMHSLSGEAQAQAARTDCETVGTCDNCGSANCGTTSDTSHTSRQDSSVDPVLPECIVCQNCPLNCVLLPCRHTCVCRVCFGKLDRCPMCRSHIESYFTLTDDDHIQVNSTSSEPLPMDFYSRFERFNLRLNQFFGFD